jgi:hypothetical protein
VRFSCAASNTDGGDAAGGDTDFGDEPAASEELLMNQLLLSQTVAEIKRKEKIIEIKAYLHEKLSKRKIKYQDIYINRLVESIVLTLRKMLILEYRFTIKNVSVNRDIMMT